MSPIRVRARSLALLLAFAAAGCGSTEPMVPLPLEGTYDLRTMNGQALPVTMITGDVLQSGVMEINADHSFVANPTYRRTNGSTFTTTIDGVITRTGDAITYADPGLPPFATGQVSNGFVTFVQPSGDVFRFEHR